MRYKCILSKTRRGLLAGLFAVLTTFAQGQTLTEKIRLNQVGFYPEAVKRAAVTGEVRGDDFYVVSTNLRDTVYAGKLDAARNSSYSTTTVRMADFSGVRKPGSYALLVPGLGHSYVFRIGNNVHDELARASIRGFYYQRMSMPLEERWAGRWHRGAGHPDTEVLVHPSAASATRPAGTSLSAPGGWYDAGDYNKYIVNSGITMGTLLSAYEDFPAYYRQLPLNIPESGNALPDLLDEALYNLRWMLTMQDPADGGVYHKCTNAAFDGMVMPGVTRLPRYMVQKGTAATLDFAAVTAQAARIFKGFDKQFPGLSDSCRRAAVRAWQWAQKNPDLAYDQNGINRQFEPDISTGAYGDRQFRDEWLWAAAELYVTTKGKPYLDTLAQRMQDVLSLPSWAQVGMLGHYTLLRQKSLPAAAAALQRTARTRLLAFADSLLANRQINAFDVVMGQTVRDFVWGSNAVAGNQGILLLNAYRLSPEPRYLDGALSNLDYILGRNATGYSFVTGIGSKTPMFPHHRPSVADGITEPVPGLLAGGPNPGRQDSCVYPFTEPETAYTDMDCSYASNEVAINWNAPLVYLSGAIEAIIGKRAASSKLQASRGF